MTKSRRHIYKRPKNKTYKVTFSKKKKFIHDILKEWTNGGYYDRDKMSIYEDDYYLYFDKKTKFYNHIHLILKDFTNNHNNHNNLIYVMKKIDTNNNNAIVHSKVIKISIFSDPEKVVRNMIRRYNEFSK
jgi:hypothetical protein